MNETLVFDCKFTTYKALDEFNSDNVKFLTLRKRNATLLQEISAVPEKEWIKAYVPIPITQRIMPKITSKGQITIPQVIRNKFGFIPGMDVEIIIEGNKALIVKSRDENKFMKWLGRGEKRSRRSIDHMVDQLRGRTDE